MTVSPASTCPACRSFADGFPNLFVKDATKIRNRHVAFLASFQHPVSIFEQLSIIYQLPRMFVGSFTLVLPYFPTGTAERVSQRFEPDMYMASPKYLHVSWKGALWLHCGATERAVEYIACAPSSWSYNGSNTCVVSPLFHACSLAG